MIQFNLLPDVKQEFIKIQRAKHLALTIASVVTIVCAVVLIILVGVVDGLQKRTLSNVGNDISTETTQINNVPNLNKILTIQNQLNSLPALESKKPIVSRLFNFINEVTPTNVTISTLKIDFSGNTLEVDGDANSLATIDQYVDTLKFTAYSHLDTTIKSPSNLSVGSASSGGSLAPSTTYYYKVTAIRGDGGESNPSTEASGSTTATNLTLPLTWKTESGISGYKIYRSTVSGSEIYLATVSTDSYTDNGVSNNQALTTNAAFSSVVLSSFGTATNQITYSIQADYAEPLFDSSNNTQLTVPYIYSTRSIVDQPTIFNSPPPISSNSSSSSQSQ